ncbi:indoleamine 2,3-dioxygenase 1 isoform X1 [Brienomyrus brachyistius]|uniref:indoleamine 2,3-dioxygenase 1 isoform X1 n=1 Tax=Brienomyrus brachyistius TaxID=42636 RepID=UPI0020B2EE71|nr:indoleamine 2,3-dioxygenase 1 isoform X1 [Brienomyrus brachyistius]
MALPWRPFSLSAYHVSEECGFILPAPQTELPTYYRPWMDIAQSVPQLVQSHTLRSRVHQMPLLESHFLESHRALRLAHLALSTITMGYVWQEGEHGTVKVLPQNVAVPLWDVSQRLGLPPILTHADGVLANWRKKNPEGPFDMENLELIITIPGGESARGFFMVTLLVEVAAIPGLKAIPKVIDGVWAGDSVGVSQALEEIAEALHSMTEALKLMHEYVNPDIFYGIMRIYLSGWKDNPSMREGLVYEGVRKEPMKFSGGSAAQSSLLHCFDELLGVQHEEQSGAFLSRMREYMPPAHKQLIRDISASPSLRHFVQDRASGPLLDSYHRCVSRLLALRNYHINIVGRFITVPAARARQLRSQGTPDEVEALGKAPTSLEERGTGGSGIMSFLKTVRNRTQETCLTWPAPFQQD